MKFRKVQCLFLILIIRTTSFGQIHEKVSFFTDFTLGISPVKLAGTFDSGSANYIIIDQNAVPTAPKLIHAEETTLLITPKFHLGLSIPVLTHEHYCIGFKLAVGGGRQFEIPGDPNLLTAYVYDLPQFIYYRNYKTSFDYSIQVGYKYTHTVLSSHLILAAFEINITNVSSIKFYASPISYKYYTYYTNGRYEPRVKIPEFGFAYSINL
jgi:hypothetical protein